MRRGAAIPFLLAVLACLVWLLWSGPGEERAAGAHSEAERGEEAAEGFVPADHVAAGEATGRAAAAPAEPPDAATPARSEHGQVELHLRFVHGRSGRPLSDATIRLFHGGETTYRSTDGGGRLEHTVHAPTVVELQYVGSRSLLPTWHVFDPEQLKIDPRNGAVQEFEIRRFQDSVRLLVRVFESDGLTPAAGARLVVLDYAEGGQRPEKAFSIAVDEDGTRSIPVSEKDGLPGLGLFADRREDNAVSDFVHFATWEEVSALEEVVLTLGTGGRVLVRATDQGGLPLPATKVWALWERIDVPFASLMIPFTAGGDGTVELAGLGVGRHTVSIRDPRSRESVDRVVVLARGESRELTVAFAAKEQLAVAGRTLDEQGRPLGKVFLSFHIPGEDSPWGTRSESDGSFALWLEPRAELTELTVDTFSSLEADVFEPERLTVPFGARGVELQRVEKLQPQRIEFTIRDAVSGAPVVEAEVWEYEPQLGEGFVRDVSDPGGRAITRMRVRASTLWGVRAPGYLDAHGPLRSDTTAVDVQLSPGTLRRWQIGHWYDGAPLPGARIVDPRSRRTLATADAGGLVENRGVPWPATFLVEHTGYRPVEWERDRRNGWSVDFIGLQPLAAPEAEGEADDGGGR